MIYNLIDPDCECIYKSYDKFTFDKKVTEFAHFCDLDIDDYQIEVNFSKGGTYIACSLTHYLRFYYGKERI